MGLCLHLEQYFGLGGMRVWSAVAKSSAFLDGKVCVYRGKTKQNGFGAIQYCI